MHSDPVRYRQSLIDALTDDGLEELTLRLVRPDYPCAHRPGKGLDGGIDVLSDFSCRPLEPGSARTTRRSTGTTVATRCAPR